MIFFYFLTNLRELEAKNAKPHYANEIKVRFFKNSLKRIKTLFFVTNFTRMSILTRNKEFCEKNHENIQRNTIFIAKIPFFSTKNGF